MSNARGRHRPTWEIQTRAGNWLRVNWRDCYATPPNIMETVRDLGFEICLDAAAESWNAKADRYIPAFEEPLTVDWDEVRSRIPDSEGKFIWLNPPYSDPGPWLKKAKETGNVICLVKNDPSVSWFYEHVIWEHWNAGAVEIIFLCGNHDKRGEWCSGRVQHSLPAESGIEVSSNAFPSALVVYHRDRNRKGISFEPISA